MAHRMTAAQYFKQLLRYLETGPEPFEDRHGLTYQAAAAAMLCGHTFETNDSLIDGVSLTIQLSTGELSWHRPNGELKVTPGPDNAARIRAYLASIERT